MLGRPGSGHVITRDRKTSVYDPSAVTLPRSSPPVTPLYPYVGPGIDFRKFLWKFDGLGDRRFPEIPLEIWDLGGKSWGGDLGVGQVRRADRVN